MWDRTQMCPVEDFIKKITSPKQMMSILLCIPIPATQSNIDVQSLPLVAHTRRALGMSQEDLADAVGVSVPTIRNLERGTGNLRSMIRVMDTLKLGWVWVRQGEDAGPALAARRRAKGLSQADLAGRVGCSRPTIIALERNLSGNLSTLLAALAALGLRCALRSTARPAGSLVPKTNAPERDLVMTPPDLAKAVIDHFTPQMAGSILDPARGAGAFFDQFPANLERHWCELREAKDFLSWKRPVDWIVTNPPWSRLRDFTRHAMPTAPNIVWLAPIVNLTTKARLRDLDEGGFGIAELLLIDTPRCWPQSGFQLAAAHIRKGQQEEWKVSRLATSE